MNCGWMQKSGSGLVLDQAPDAAQGLEAGELLQLAGDRLAALQRQSRHHALEALVRLREPVDPRGLGQMLRQIDIDLDEHESARS